MLKIKATHKRNHAEIILTDITTVNGVMISMGLASFSFYFHRKQFKGNGDAIFYSGVFAKRTRSLTLGEFDLFVAPQHFIGYCPWLYCNIATDGWVDR